MTIKDAVEMWLESHKLEIIHSAAFGGWTCRDSDVKGTFLSLSNHMSLSFSETDGFIQITGSLSKKSYKVHISDPSLFPVLDRALDEEDKWIRDGHRAPEDELGDKNN
jgi:hypothetical protein